MTSKILAPNFISSHTKTPNHVTIDPSNSFTYISLPNKTDQFHSHNYNKIHSRHMISSFQQPITITNTNTNTSTNTNTAISTSSSVSSLCDMWREIQGSEEWENLLNPLDSLLREEIIRYGEFVNACYEAFDLDPTSRRYLNCKYGKRSMLQQVGLERSGYKITRYIYATPDVNIPGNTAAGARWVGYVAVSTDESVARLGRRDILVAFRGTVTNPEWVSNFMSSLTPARLDPNDARPDVRVESGFLSLYTSDESRHSKFGLQSCREQLLSEISSLLNKYKRNDHELSVTLSGHSMGSSLALLLGYDILELGLINHREIPVTVFSFGGPRVGNSGFKNRCYELGLKVLRIVNVNDPITNLPGVVFNENLQLIIGGESLPWSYSHVGVQLELEFFDVQNPSSVHDLETYITLLRRRPKGRRTRRNRRKSSSSGDNNLFMGMSRDLFSGAHTTQQAIWQIFGTLLPSQMI